MDSIGGSSFLSLSEQRKKRTKERKSPAILLGLAPILYGGQLETRFAQTIELLNPPPFIFASPAGPAGLRMAGELNGILMWVRMK